MKCLYCSRELGLLRSLKGHSFCCEEHRRLYFGKEKEFFLKRVTEWDSDSSASGEQLTPDTGRKLAQPDTVAGALGSPDGSTADKEGKYRLDSDPWEDYKRAASAEAEADAEIGAFDVPALMVNGTIFRPGRPAGMNGTLPGLPNWGAPVLGPPDQVISVRRRLFLDVAAMEEPAGPMDAAFEHGPAGSSLLTGSAGAISLPDQTSETVPGPAQQSLVQGAAGGGLCEPQWERAGFEDLHSMASPDAICEQMGEGHAPDSVATSRPEVSPERSEEPQLPAVAPARTGEEATVEWRPTEQDVTQDWNATASEALPELSKISCAPLTIGLKPVTTAAASLAGTAIGEFLESHPARLLFPEAWQGRVLGGLDKGLDTDSSSFEQQDPPPQPLAEGFRLAPVNAKPAPIVYPPTRDECWIERSCGFGFPEPNGTRHLADGAEPGDEAGASKAQPEATAGSFVYEARNAAAHEPCAEQAAWAEGGFPTMPEEPIGATSEVSHQNSAEAAAPVFPVGAAVTIPLHVDLRPPLLPDFWSETRTGRLLSPLRHAVTFHPVHWTALCWSPRRERFQAEPSSHRQALRFRRPGLQLPPPGDPIRLQPPLSHPVNGKWRPVLSSGPFDLHLEDNARRPGARSMPRPLAHGLPSLAARLQPHGKPERVSVGPRICQPLELGGWRGSA